MEVSTIARDVGFTEGPVFSRHGYILVTSIDRGRLYKIFDGNQVEVFAELSGGPNGAAEGEGGATYVAQNGGAWPASPAAGVTGGIQVVFEDGRIDWLSRVLVSPNDLCFGPDGALYVTDPSRPRELNEGRLWRIDPITGDTDLLAGVDWYPNGIGFGLEDDCIYVASTNHQQIVRFPLDDGKLGQPEVVIQMKRGYPDGFAFDCEGNLVVAAVSFDESPGELQTWSLDGRLLDSFSPGSAKFYTNVALDHDGRLLVTASDSQAVLIVEGQCQQGLALHPFRNAMTQSGK